MVSVGNAVRDIAMIEAIGLLECHYVRLPALPDGSVVPVNEQGVVTRKIAEVSFGIRFYNLQVRPLAINIVCARMLDSGLSHASWLQRRTTVIAFSP